MDIWIAWTGEAKDHIARRGVSCEEVDLLLRSKKFYTGKHRDGLLVLGRARSRLLLVVVVRSSRVPDAFEVVTARDATASEKHLWARRGKGIL